VWDNSPGQVFAAVAPDTMSEITLTVPDDTAEALQVPPSELAATLKLAAAMKLFELGQLSSGAAARLAGIPRVLFLERLADFGIDTFRQTDEELDAELRHA
jgi:predicted HTH domain antitoxin